MLRQGHRAPRLATGRHLPKSLSLKGSLKEDYEGGSKNLGVPLRRIMRGGSINLGVPLRTMRGVLSISGFL